MYQYSLLNLRVKKSCVELPSVNIKGQVNETTSLIEIMANILKYFSNRIITKMAVN